MSLKSGEILIHLFGMKFLLLFQLMKDHKDNKAYFEVFKLYQSDENNAIVGQYDNDAARIDANRGRGNADQNCDVA